MSMASHHVNDVLCTRVLSASGMTVAILLKDDDPGVRETRGPRGLQGGTVCQGPTPSAPQEWRRRRCLLAAVHSGPPGAALLRDVCYSPRWARGGAVARRPGRLT